MGTMMGQGSNRHCGNLEPHERHENELHVGPLGGSVPEGSWCDGIPPLEPFVELVVRTPLRWWGFPDDYPHESVVRDIVEEGIAPFTTDELFEDGHAVGSLRVRWGGVDKVYPLKDGKVEA